MTRSLMVVFVTLLSTAAAAQQAPSGCATPEHRQFDFWIGEWIVTDSAGGTPYGTNRISREEAGCLLHERWGGSQGGSGQSFNFYDRQRKHWEQVWVASGGNVLRLSGHFNGTSMILEGDATAPGGGALRNRIVWTQEPDGRVRQVWSTSTDDGKTWQVSFDGWYRTKPG